MSEKLQSVSIAIGSTMYGRFEDLPNTVSHDLAEFVDNALQSYRDNKLRLQSIEPDYRLKVTIEIEWNDTDNRAKTITITDNASGISIDKHQKAFMPAETPENNKGLNEFGMGLKTAACWLGESWTVKTKALGENVERTLSFNLNDVIANELKELPVKETTKDINEHYTIVHITDPTKNVPAIKSLAKIRTELASIYRKSLRENEMQFIVCGEELSFTEYEILTTPFVRTPDAPPIYWKKEIDFKFGKYSAKGYIAILKTMNKDHNRIVLLRRGRVIVGAETEGRYYSKHISGQAGSPRDKRIFGELELSGFEVTFNKNDVQDKENLEALFEALQGEIHTKEFDLTTQAQDYRPDENRKLIKKIVTKHNTSAKANRQPIAINTASVPQTENVLFPSTQQVLTTPPQDPKPNVIDQYEDKYAIDGINYTLNVQFVESGTDLFWVDVSRKNDNIIICQINTKHIFFEHFGKPNEAIIAIIKTLAIAKFTARQKENSATNLFNDFNNYIKLIILGII